MDIDEHVDAMPRDVGDEPAAWIGHSFGGRLAFELAAARPEPSTKLVLARPSDPVDPAQSLSRGGERRARSALRVVRGGVDRRFGESLLTSRPRARRPGSRIACQTATTGAALPLLPVGRDRGVRRDGIGAAAVRRRPGSRRWSCSGGVVPPVRPPPRRTSSALGDLLEVAVVPGGHTVLWDAFEETAAAITGFLEI